MNNRKDASFFNSDLDTKSDQSRDQLAAFLTQYATTEGISLAEALNRFSREVTTVGKTPKVHTNPSAPMLRLVTEQNTTTNAMTISEAFEIYFRMHVKVNCSRPSQVRSAFRRYWGSIQDTPVIELNGREVAGWLNQLCETYGKATANKQLNILKACVHYVADYEYVELLRNPFKTVKHFKIRPQERYLKKGTDYKRIMELLDEYPSQSAAVLKLLLWTGQRKSNVLGMRWEDIDLSNQAWVIPAVEAKGRKTIPVALSSKALEVLLAQPKCSEFVFPSSTSASGHIERIEHVWHRIRSKAGLPNLRPHDLRHTCGTWLGQAGANAFVIQKALGHSTANTTMRYTHMNVADVLAQLEKAQS